MTPETEAESNVEQAVPFFMVRSLEDSLRCYVEGIGFTVAKRWINEGKLEWCWLQLGGAALMLQQYRPGRVPEGNLGAGVSVCFQCKDALALYREMRGRGLQPSRPFVGNGMWVTTLKDPDGYKLDFESPTDLPEETELPEPGE